MVSGSVCALYIGLSCGMHSHSGGVHTATLCLLLYVERVVVESCLSRDSVTGFAMTHCIKSLRVGRKRPSQG